MGAGRKRKPLHLHLAHGTFRPERHAELLPRVEGSAAPVLAVDVPPIPAFLLEGLGEPGRRFLVAEWAAKEFTGAEQVLLRQAARALDDAETAKGASARRMAIRLFAALTGQLRTMEAK